MQIKLIIFLSILCCIFATLSYRFYSDKAEAESALVVAIDANSSLQKSLNLQVESCKINDQVTTEFQTEKKTKDDATNSVLSSIDKIPVSHKSSQAPKEVANEINTVNIDDKLPSDIILMLQSHCDTNKGSACVNP
jgi:hypothetical protein